MLKIGQRVSMSCGSIGHVESFDDAMTCNVRDLTPNNTPSCCVTACFVDSLVAVPESVVPIRRNEQWWREARDFINTVNNALQD